MGMKVNLFNRMTLCSVSSVFLLLVNLPVTTSLIKKYVRKGESTSLECVVEPDYNYSPVWVFNNKVIYTKSLPYPRDIGIDNVCGEIVNNTHSNLYIHQFQAKNEGNYTCSLNRTNYCEYVLKLIDDRSQPMNSTSHLQLYVNLNSSVHDGIVFFPKGENLFLNCLAFSISGNASMYWTMQTTVEENEGERMNYRRNNHETCYIEAQLSFTLVENINLTCHVTQEGFGSLQGNVTISISIQTNDSSEIPQAEDTNYTLLFVTVCIIPLVVFGSAMLISVACWMKRRRKTDMGMKMILFNRMTLRGVLSVFLFLVILPETISLMRKYVRKGESTSLECVVKPEYEYSPVWIFNNKVIYTESLPYPRDIGIDNVCGEIVNNTHSNLYIHQFQATNEGNYTCSLNQTNYSEYVLKLIDDRSQPMNSTSHLQLYVNLNSSVHDSIISFPQGENLFLNCLAFSISGNASMYWTMQPTFEENEGERKNYRRSNHETCYIEAQLSFILVKNINVTCHVTQEGFGSLQGNVTISISIQTNDSSGISQAEDTNYTLLFVTVCIIPLVVFGSVMLISVACWIRRRRKTDIHYTDGISIYCEVELPKESNVSTQPTPLAYKRVT